MSSGIFIIAVTKDYKMNFNFKISFTVTPSVPTEERQYFRNQILTKILDKEMVSAPLTWISWRNTTNVEVFALLNHPPRVSLHHVKFKLFHLVSGQEIFRKRTVSADFWAIPSKICRNCSSEENFVIKKLFWKSLYFTQCLWQL